MIHFELLVCLMCVSEAAKQRTWIDSSVSLLQGDIPSAREGHRLSSTVDGKIYLFGGRNGGGDGPKSRDTHSVAP